MFGIDTTRTSVNAFQGLNSSLSRTVLDAPLKQQTAQPTSITRAFSISYIPYELRQLVYTHYFSTLELHEITKDNASLPLHLITPLGLASPFLLYDTSPALFHTFSSFSFSSGEDMRRFSQLYNRSSCVRRIRILYGRDPCPTRDWVFLMNLCFSELEEVTFSADGVGGGLR